MSFGLYLHRASPVHAAPAAVKLVTLLIAGIVVFLLDNPFVLAAAVAAVAVLFVLARLPAADVWRQMWPALILVGVVVLVHVLFTGWRLGLTTGLRFAVLIGLATLLTMTTRASDMIDTLERALRPFSRFGVRPARFAFLVALAIRLIPVLFGQVREIQEAQRVRGLDRNPIAVIVPLLIRSLRMAEELSEAIEARGFDPD